MGLGEGLRIHIKKNLLGSERERSRQASAFEVCAVLKKMFTYLVFQMPSLDLSSTRPNHTTANSL